MLTRDNFEMLRLAYKWDQIIGPWQWQYTPKNLVYTLNRLPYKDRVVVMACLRHVTWIGGGYSHRPHTISDIMSEIGSVERQLSQEKSFILIKYDWDRVIDWVYTLSIEDGKVLDYYPRHLL